ncbi:putative reverse transcriptase domain-containing protein, partial [Tanacetum coccineum]
KSSDEDDDNEVSISKDDDDDAENEDDDERQDEEDKEEEGSDLRVQTPSHFESTDDETYDEVTKGNNVEGEELDEEEINEEEEVNELYRDVSVNLEGRDTEMTDALLANVQTTQVIEDTHVMITAITPEVQQQSSSVSSGFISNMFNPNPDIGIDSILILNIESTTLVNVPVTTNVEMPPSSITTLPPPPIPLFEDRVKALEDDFSEFKQTNQFDEAVSSIPGIVDKYLANQMNEAIKSVVQLQSDKLRSEAQADNEDFINKIDENTKKIIKEQVKTSHGVAANLSELELKKILIDKIDNNKSIDRSIQQKTLYKALVDAYETDKDILETYGDNVTLKRRRDDEDKDEEPSVGSKRGSKIRRAGKEPKSTSTPKEKTSKSTGKSKESSKYHQTSTGKSAQAEEPIHADEDLEEPAHQEFNTGFTEDQLVDETTQHPDCTLTQYEDPRESFNELIDTLLDFSTFVLNRLKIDTLTLELLASPTFELMKGSCKSLVELEYYLEEVCKATTDQLDSNNPEGHQYPHDLRKPKPLISNSRGLRVIPFDHFINNDLAYLSGRVSSQTYATSVTKTKAADYGHIKWIEDLVPNTMESTHDVYSRNKIIGIKKLTIVEWHNYKHLEWITVRRDDDKLYTFKESDYNRLRLQDIEYMLLLLVQGKLTNLNVEERLALGNKDKKNRLMRIDELHKFSNGTLNNVRSALDDILKQIRMEYLPQTRRYVLGVSFNCVSEIVTIRKAVYNFKGVESVEIHEETGRLIVIRHVDPVKVETHVRIMQISQENGQNRTNTDTKKEREYKSWENAIKGQQKSTLGQY